MKRALALALWFPLLALAGNQDEERLSDSVRSSLQAAVTLLESQDNDLIGRVLDGCEPLLRAANKVRSRARLIRAFEDASVADCIAFGAAVGPGVVFDRVVVPAL